MGIPIEFNPDLALRAHNTEGRLEEECIPKNLIPGKEYQFLKKGQRVYWLSDDEEWARGEIPLCITEGDEKLSRPIASVKIIEATHFLNNGEVYTRGKYRVIEVFDQNDQTIHFENMKRKK